MDAGSYRETHRVTKNGQSSDVSTVIELLQAVSAERVVERVVEAVVASAVRHVGAARAQLVLCQGAADGEKACATDDASAIGSRLALPVRRGERLLGVLCLEFAAPSAAPSPGQLFLAELLASQAAMSLEHARHYESAGKENQKRREAAAQSERVQTALKESEARFRLMADTTPDIIWITQLDPERVVYASPSFERVFGKTVADLYANPHLWIEGIHPEDRERVGASFVAWIGADSGEPWEVEFRVVHPNGSVRWIHDRGVFTGEAGGPQRVSGIATDITERHLAQVALRESEQRYALAMDAARDGHWDWVAETDNFYASPRMLEIYGFPPETRFSGRQDFLDRFPFHPEDKARWYAAASEHFAGETARFDIEIRLLRGAEVRWIHTTGLIARDPHGRPTRYTGSVNDITVRKDAEAALRASEHFRRRAEAALQQAQRLEALGTLAGGIAHDFNNILGAILGFGEMALRDSRSGSRVRRDVESMLTAGERGRSLVERILAFSRSGVGERVPVHLEAVVREAVDMVSAGLPGHIAIQLDLNGGRAATVGDAAQLHQVVMNLAANAIQAMEGGVLHLTLDPIRLEEPRLVTTGEVAIGDYLLLGVRDSGCGMAPEILGRIFDPFFTTKDVGTGTGLGLSIVHGIVSELGGAIDVASSVGVGSTFTVYLPRVGDALEVAERKAAPLQRGRLEQILLVDDEEALVRLMTGTLVDLGYAPVGFTSGTEALAAFAAHPERFDAVVTDERMPGLSGAELIRAVRAISPTIPVVMVSGYLGTGIEQRAREAGADAVLRKPLVTAELATALARALQATASAGPWREPPRSSVRPA